MIDVSGLAALAFAAMTDAANSALAERAFVELGRPATTGVHEVEVPQIGDGVRIVVPHCNGRGRVLVDGAAKDPGSKGPLAIVLEGRRVHDLRIEVNVSSYEKRIACASWRTADTARLIRFASPHAPKPFAGEAVLVVPRAHDATKPSAMLVGLHPWNGTPWTYAAYRELVDEAAAKDVVLLMPSGLGNSLYVEDAEDEVMRAIEAAKKELAVDPQRVSIWGASMGGAGATTVSFHRPDKFAFVASYFGDSRYDLTTYVRGILGGEDGAHRVNALDVVENARHLPVRLVHGEADRTSPIAESVMLYDAMKKLGFDVRFDRVPNMGHEGPLVVKFIREIVDEAATARAPERPARVSYRSVRPGDTEAYGVHIVKTSPRGDAFIDLERPSHVLAREGVASFEVDP